MGETEHKDPAPAGAPSPGPSAAELALLRDEIDRIDAAIHASLLDRGRIVDRLIAAKGTVASGSAFRPGREADMMRRLVARHEAQATILPLSTVESIWRVIVATFTFVQAPFSVHADVSGDAIAASGAAANGRDDASLGDAAAAMRDSARFHFGFVPPFRPQASAGAVIAAVDGSRGDLGLLRADRPGGEAWWRGLEGEARPKIIARLPFVIRDDHPAPAPVFVVAKPVEDPGAVAGARDVVLRSVALERWRPAARGALAALGLSPLAEAAHGDGLALLLEGPPEPRPELIAAALGPLALGAGPVHEVGGHAARVKARAAA